MRSYLYDDQKLHTLFTGLVNRLSQEAAPENLTYGLLKDICEHFRFGRGLIYEADHAGFMTLAADYAIYGGHDNWLARLNLSDYLSERDLDLMKKDHLFLVRPSENQNDNFEKLAELFNANSLLISPVVDGRGRLLGLIILLDRRRQVLLDAVSVNAARTVTKLLANYVKTSIIQRQLDYAHTAMTSILDNMGVDIFVSDSETREILFINQSMAERYGLNKNLSGQRCCQAFFGSDAPECDLCRQSHNAGAEERAENKIKSWDFQNPQNGDWYRIFSAYFKWVDGRPAQVVTCVDISENKKKEEIINHLAFFDQVTQLPNRRNLLRHFSKNLPFLKQPGNEAWVLFFDLDNFKQVNDTLGHQSGDRLLFLVGRFIEDELNQAGHFYRLGGDEFVLYFENVSRIFILKTIDQVLARFKEPWPLENGSPVCGTSIGVSHYPADGDNMETLLYWADKALYKAKSAGKGRACFADDLEPCITAPDNNGDL